MRNNKIIATMITLQNCKIQSLLIMSQSLQNIVAWETFKLQLVALDHISLSHQCLIQHALSNSAPYMLFKHRPVFSLNFSKSLKWWAVCREHLTWMTGDQGKRLQETWTPKKKTPQYFFWQKVRCQCVIDLGWAKITWIKLKKPNAANAANAAYTYTVQYNTINKLVQ